MNPVVHPGSRLRGAARWTGSLALTLAAVLGVVSVLVVVLGGLFGFTPVIVRSGSMEPELPTGALALTRTVAASGIDVGDVISVTRGDVTVTHRVVSIEKTTTGGQTPAYRVQLKGDANSAPDPATDVIESAPRLVAHLPWVGRAIAWLSTPPGIYLLALYLALCLGLVVRGGSPSTQSPRPRRAAGTNPATPATGRRRREVPPDPATTVADLTESGPEPEQR